MYGDIRTVVQFLYEADDKVSNAATPHQHISTLTKVPAISLSVNFIVVSLQFSNRGRITHIRVQQLHSPTKHFAATRSMVNTHDVHLQMCTRSDRSGVRLNVSPFFPS